MRIKQRYLLLSCVVAFLLPIHLSGLVNGEGGLVLKNQYILITFGGHADHWRLKSISRQDGSDMIRTNCDVFEILMLSGDRYIADDYVAQGPLHNHPGEEKQRIQISYKRKYDTPQGAPDEVLVTYWLAGGPRIYKEVYIPLEEGDFIDRLQVLRLSTDEKTGRGGQGEPVFIGNWFAGLDYPGFHGWHADGYQEPDYFYRHPYNINYQGRDLEDNPREGLVTCFHFPGHAKQFENGAWGIQSKRAVMGLSKKKGESAELALLEYMHETRKPTRSHTHFNNWFTIEAKDITVDNTIAKVFIPMMQNLDGYGAKLDAFCPDNGWQKSRDYSRIFEAKIDEKHDSLTTIRRVVEAHGSRVGIWISLDGTNMDQQYGVKSGYKPGISEDFHITHRWQNDKKWFDILDPTYQSDIMESIRYLLEDVNVDYIKHDFNHNFTSDYITQRHAREACLDVTLEILAWERSINPAVFQNYTNGTWFSPWWLQNVDAIWMMSGDAGNFARWPQLSLRDMATSYRDYYFFENFNNPERVTRPVIPIANFMTHGIIYSSKKPFTDGMDRIEDWANYVMMYLGRGTTLKELYLSPELLTEGEWRVLGKGLNWAQRNQDGLMNTVLIGGNISEGEAYGYLSWEGKRAILTVRNPDRMPQKLVVPFDGSVYFRGESGTSYFARTIYPYDEVMPWKLTSGSSFELEIPGDRVIIYEIMEGESPTQEVLVAKELPPFIAKLHRNSFELDLSIPDDTVSRYDLLVQPGGNVFPALTINGKSVDPVRQRNSDDWTLSSYDLSMYKGEHIQIKGALFQEETARGPVNEKLELDIYLTVDRKIADQERPEDPNLPVQVSQNYRRVNQHLMNCNMEVNQYEKKQ